MMNGAESIHVETLSTKGPQARFDWSIARLLREQYPGLRLRAQVRNHLLLEKVTLGSLLHDPLSLDAFLEEFRSIPQCGSMQVTRLREVLVSALRAAGSTGPGAFRQPEMEAMPAAASDRAVALQPPPMACKHFPDCLDAADDVFFGMWRLAQFDPFVYLPTTVPEFAKIPEVLAVELDPGRDVSEYLERLAGLRRAFDNISQAEGLILVDGQALEAVFSRQGRYAALSREAVEQQIGMLKRTLLKLPPGVSCKVCDFEISGLSSGAFVGNKGVLCVMGGYLVFEEPRFLASLQPRFRTAREQGRPLAEFLEAIC